MDEIPFKGPAMEERFNNMEMFLKATKPRGYEDYYNPRAPLLGKELSIGNIERNDMLANDMAVWAILDLLNEGQIDFAWDYMTWYQNDWKSSMSIDGRLLDSLTSQEIRYSQKQELHEYQHPIKKRGFFSPKQGEQ